MAEGKTELVTEIAAVCTAPGSYPHMCWAFYCSLGWLWEIPAHPLASACGKKGQAAE